MIWLYALDAIAILGVLHKFSLSRIYMMPVGYNYSSLTYIEMGTMSVYDTRSSALTFLLIVLRAIFHICASVSYMRVIMHGSCVCCDNPTVCIKHVAARIN